MMAIEGDSADYEYLTEAVAMSAGVEGMCCEIGLRRGMGTKTIIDAVREYCPNKLVVSVDPYGNIPYTGREPDGETHYDYTDDMRNDCMTAMWSYVRNNPVDWRFIQMRDIDYFRKYKGGVERYWHNGGYTDCKYSMCHLDGPHTIKDVSFEIEWFNDRMESGSTIVIDDVTPDFIDIDPIKVLFDELGWELVKIGNKKGIWRKK